MKEIQVFKRRSPRTGKVNEMTIEIDEKDYQSWVDGELIQRALPYLSPDEREFLMTGLTPEDWAAIFPKEEQ